MIKKMVKGNMFGKMEIFILDNGKKNKEMEKDKKDIKMEINMMELG